MTSESAPDLARELSALAAAERDSDPAVAAAATVALRALLAAQPTRVAIDALSVVLDDLIDAADAPEDWSGAVDVEAEDLDREFEDNARSALSSPQDRSLRR